MMYSHSLKRKENGKFVFYIGKPSGLIIVFIILLLAKF